MITSTSNEKIKHVIGLVTSAKNRRKERLFVVEGERMVREIPSQRIRECFVSESFSDYACIPEGVDYEVVSDAVFKKMSDTMTPQGVMCVVTFADEDIEKYLDEHKNGRLKLLVLEGIQDPGNLGTMLRTAEGAGFDAIIADEKTVSIYNPKVTRSTMGAIFRLPIIYVDNLLEVIDKLKSLDVNICAAHLKGECDYDDMNYSNRTAILIGNEGNGLSDEISAKSDTLVKIPMEGKVESLNAAVAAALMMYEVRKY